jgi:hypothetical protein
MSRCRSCNAPVVWARTTKGKNIPLDAEDSGGWAAPVTPDDGNLQPTGERVPTRDGQTAMVVEVVAAGEGKYRSHFVTCPEAGEWRKR